MLFPAWAIVGGFALLYFALSSADGLVVDDYYRQGRIIDQTIARSEHAAALGLVADLELRAGRLGVELSSDNGALLPETILVSIVHPTRSGRDQILRLEGEAGVYAGALAPLTAGRWLVQIEDSEKAWRLRGAVQLPDETRSTIYPYER